VVFDVGANRGQTIDLICRSLRKPKITAFEPNPELIARLQAAYGTTNITLEGIALGSSSGVREFNVLENHELSSFLELDRSTSNPFRQTPLHVRCPVPVDTLDSYVKARGVNQLDLLKIDVQGYDLEVLRGASGLLADQLVETILIEVNFVQMYVGQGSFGEIERYLWDRGYGLLCMYEIVRTGECVSWATACFRATAGN
jgi:FkbM family methyltransferase